MSDVFKSFEVGANELHKVNGIRDAAERLWELYDRLDRCGESGRMVAIAKTNLEQSVMWAVKAVSRADKSE